MKKITNKLVRARQPVCLDPNCLSRRIQLLEFSCNENQSELLLLCLSCGMLQSLGLSGVLQENSDIKKSKSGVDYIN